MYLRIQGDIALQALQNPCWSSDCSGHARITKSTYRTFTVVNKCDNSDIHEGTVTSVTFMKGQWHNWNSLLTEVPVAFVKEQWHQWHCWINSDIRDIHAGTVTQTTFMFCCQKQSFCYRNIIQHQKHASFALIQSYHWHPCHWLWRCKMQDEKWGNVKHE